jgi:hypothetical protein
MQAADNAIIDAGEDGRRCHARLRGQTGGVRKHAREGQAHSPVPLAGHAGPQPRPNFGRQTIPATAYGQRRP